MVANRKQHTEPVIRALLALPGETLVEASAFLVAGFVYLDTKLINRKQQFMYKAKPVVKLTGSEQFINTGKQFSVLDFWQYGFSNLNSNVLRGALAEFLVEQALKETDDIELRSPWGDFDVSYQGKKIEVKCCSYLQDWDQNGLSKVIWSGLKARELYYNDAVGKQSNKEADYKSDIYVLSLLHHQETETLDILNMDQWSFYILSKDEVKEITKNGNSVSLIRLEKHSKPRYSFAELQPIIKAF